MRIKRSQAAIEFLATYGWAILVVTVLIAALAYAQKCKAFLARQKSQASCFERPQR